VTLLFNHLKQDIIYCMENRDRIKYPRGKHPNSHTGGFKKGNTVWLGKKLSATHRAKLSLSKIGAKNPMFGVKRRNENTIDWSLDRIGYVRLHKWVRRQIGKPNLCSNCNDGTRATKDYHWANISKLYKKDVTDWIRLCAKCHSRWDRGLITINK